jgi:hypothetical protein
MIIDKKHEEKVIAPNPTPMEEVLDTRSPAQIEADLVNKAETAAIRAAEKVKPEDRAAMFFQQLFPQFAKSIQNLNRKELARLCEALVHYPLGEVMPRSANGAQALMVGLQLTDAKLVMRETIAIEERMKMDQKAKDEAKALADSAISNFEFGNNEKEGNKE